MKIASHREVGLIGIGLKGSTSLDLSVYVDWVRPIGAYQ